MKVKNLLLFSDNIIFEKWNENLNNYDLIDYVLPSEDLEDKFIKTKL